MSDVAIVPVDRLELTFAPKPWAFAVEHRAEIDAHFAGLQRAQPAIWNGRVLLLHERRIVDGVLHGAYLETDYASFTAWVARGRRPAGVYDCFGAAAIIAADGAVLLGVMGPQNFNAGRIYFPCGMPEPNDIAGTRVDLERSMWRELQEETGFDPAEFSTAPGWMSVDAGPIFAQVKLLQSRESAEALQARGRAYLAREREPELSDLRIVRGRQDFDTAMPGFVTAFLERYFAERALAKRAGLA